MRIRYAEPADAEEVAGFLVRNRTYFQPTEPTRSDEYFTTAGQRRRLERAARERDAGRSALFLIRLDGELVGRMNLGGIVRGAFQSANVGYAVDQKCAGRGIASAARACQMVCVRSSSSEMRDGCDTGTGAQRV